MNPRNRLMIALLSIGALVPVAGALGEEVTPPTNRVANPGAESGVLTPWSGTGYTIGTYGAEGAPPTASATRDGLGQRFFAATQSGADLVQVVDLSDLQAALDQPDATLNAQIFLGAAGGTEDDPRATFQPLSGDGTNLGQPTVFAAPSNAERGGQTGLVERRGAVPVPVGARAVRVTVTAGGVMGQASTAIADRVLVELPPRFSPVPNPPSPAPSPAQPTPTQPTRAQPPVAAPRLTMLRLTRGAVEMRTSRAARTVVTVTRRVQRSRTGTVGWRVVKRLSVQTSDAGKGQRRFKRLSPGAYRATVSIAGKVQPRRASRLFR